MKFQITNIVTVVNPMDVDSCFFNSYDPNQGKYVPTKWRISGFYKTYAKKKPSNDFIAEFLREEFKKKPVMEQLKESFSKKLIQCSPEEAEYAGLSGVCGAIVPISHLTYEGEVGWTPEVIRQHQTDYNNRLDNDAYMSMGLFDSHIDPNFTSYWRLLTNGLEGNEDLVNGDYQYCSAWCDKFANKKYFEMFKY